MQEPAATNDLAPLELDFDPEYVLGFPLHIAVTVQAARVGVNFSYLPLATIFSSEGAIGLTLTRDTGEVVLQFDPATLSIDDGITTYELRGGEQRRMLIDLSESLWNASREITEGVYTLSLSYQAFFERPVSPAVPIALRRPTPQEQKVLDDLRPALQRARTWGRWTYMTPLQAAEVALTDSPHLKDDPLRFTRMLRHLLDAAIPLSAHDVEKLNLLTGVYEPEAAALQAEVLKLLGDETEFRRQAQAVRLKYPGLSWWVDAVEAGESLIAWQRRTA